jgi:son of sevenless-like protein
VISFPNPQARRRSKLRLDLLKIDYKIIAAQLTVYESGLYAKITPQQCLTYVKTRTGDDVAKLRDFCSTHDKLDAWVKTTILSDELDGPGQVTGQVTGQGSRRRAQIIDHWIKVAEACLFSSTSSVVRAQRYCRCVVNLITSRL